MDIGSGNTYPSNALSNFAPHSFVIDGVKCASMEGFLQSLKTNNPDMQEHICGLVGRAAKFAGKKKKWQTTQTLYWKGVAYPRKGEEYQQLISRAFDELYTNTGFKKALKAAGNATFTHSIGRRKQEETVLTITEFVGNLNRLRNKL